MPYPLSRAAGLALCAAMAAPASAAEAACRSTSPATAATLVELYTSEGCSSCPPADRWLSSMRARPNVVAAAFHVHYWDRLGWRDRFGSAEFSRRQERQRAVNGAPYAYTPQVVVDGRDRPEWFRQPPPPPAGRPAPVRIDLSVDAGGATAVVAALPGAPALLAGWWAVTEDGHGTAVTAGENEGATLRHDAVVREQREIAAWAASAERPLRLAFAPAVPASPGHPRRIVLVVTDAGTGRPLQALQLACPSPTPG